LTFSLMRLSSFLPDRLPFHHKNLSQRPHLLLRTTEPDHSYLRAPHPHCLSHERIDLFSAPYHRPYVSRVLSRSPTCPGSIASTLHPRSRRIPGHTKSDRWTSRYLQANWKIRVRVLHLANVRLSRSGSSIPRSKRATKGDGSRVHSASTLALMRSFWERTAHSRVCLREHNQ
jgi:hypothetical protein